MSATLTVALEPSGSQAALRRLVLGPAASAAGLRLAVAAPGGVARARLLEGSAARLNRICGNPAGQSVAGQSVNDAWPAAVRARLLPQASTGCSLGVAIRSTVLAWDGDRLPGPPGWSDFWDVARHPGRRGLFKGPRGTLEIALLADGVAAGDVYRALSNQAGIDRAFRKLDQLRPYIVWWRRDDEPERLLANRLVLLTSAPAERITLAEPEHRNLDLSYARSLFAVDGWALAGASRPGPAERRLADGLTDPARLAAYAAASGLGTPAPAGASRIATALQFDEAFWAANDGKLAAQFDHWLQR